jgi:hypothetical protein
VLSRVRPPRLPTIKRYSKIVWSKTKNFDRGDGFIIHGISRVSASKFDYELPQRMTSGVRDGNEEEAVTEPAEELEEA